MIEQSLITNIEDDALELIYKIYDSLTNELYRETEYLTLERIYNLYPYPFGYYFISGYMLNPSEHTEENSKKKLFYSNAQLFVDLLGSYIAMKGETPSIIKISNIKEMLSIEYADLTCRGLDINSNTYKELIDLLKTYAGLNLER